MRICTLNVNMHVVCTSLHKKKVLSIVKYLVLAIFVYEEVNLVIVSALHLVL